MLLFFAVDIDELRWHDFVLLSLVFVILEFLLLVACNAIQVMYSQEEVQWSIFVCINPQMM